MVTLSLYHEIEHGRLLQSYSLCDSTHTDTPQNIIEMSKKDRDRYPVAILDQEDGYLIGFFCLHINAKKYGYDLEDYGEKERLVRLTYLL